MGVRKSSSQLVVCSLYKQDFQPTASRADRINLPGSLSTQSNHMGRINLEPSQATASNVMGVCC